MNLSASETVAVEKEVVSEFGGRLDLKRSSRALRSGAGFLIVEPRHHASASERDLTETTARAAGFALEEHPTLKRDWAVLFL